MSPDLPIDTSEEIMEIIIILFFHKIDKDNDHKYLVFW